METPLEVAASNVRKDEFSKMSLNGVAAGLRELQGVHMLSTLGLRLNLLTAAILLIIDERNK